MKHQDFENHLSSIKSYLVDELSKLRVGRATTSLIEDVMVDAYPGSAPLPINELASVTIPDAQSLLIAPWDKSVTKKIEEAIIKSGKGLNPVNEGDQIRVPVPMLTEDRRRDMVKEISKLVEQSKIKVRTLRQDVIRAVEEQQDNGVVSEDEMFRMKKDIEAEVTRINEELEALGAKKETELMTI